MTTDIISTESFKQRFKILKESLFKKMKAIDYQIG
jgi:hypothetical protein